jgi:hypothetical protein
MGVYLCILKIFLLFSRFFSIFVKNKLNPTSNEINRFTNSDFRFVLFQC